MKTWQGKRKYKGICARWGWGVPLGKLTGYFRVSFFNQGVFQGQIFLTALLRYNNYRITQLLILSVQL